MGSVTQLIVVPSHSRESILKHEAELRRSGALVERKRRVEANIAYSKRRLSWHTGMALIAVLGAIACAIVLAHSGLSAKETHDLVITIASVAFGAAACSTWHHLYKSFVHFKSQNAYRLQLIVIDQNIDPAPYS